MPGPFSSSGNKGKKELSGSSGSSGSSGKDIGEKGDLGKAKGARKRAAVYSSLYRDDKKGVEVTRPIRINQSWPDFSSSPQTPKGKGGKGELGEGGKERKKAKSPSKDVIIAKLLQVEGYSRKDAIQKVCGADVIEDRVVRGILVFSRPISGKEHSSPNPLSPSPQKRVVTPKGFWKPNLDYSELMSNYETGFRGLYEKRQREGTDMLDLVEWADIQEFRLYIDQDTGERGPVPLDSRKATDLLNEFSSLLSSRNADGAKRDRGEG